MKPLVIKPLVIFRYAVFSMLFIMLPAALAQSSQTGTGGAAATVDGHATQAALAILSQGGNAVDAAVAAAAVINVTNPFSAGIGGGGFMLVYLADEGRVLSIDSREMAPAAARPDMFIDEATGEPIPFRPERISSGLSVGVPGTLAGWDEALRRYGALDLATVLAPAIALAEEGFEISEVFAGQVESNLERFVAFPATAELYLTPEGTVPEAGSLHRNPDLAETFRLIAQGGINAFYRGEIGEDLVAVVQDPPAAADPPFTIRGQDMTMADLDAYFAPVRDVTRSDYRGYEIFGMGPPSSGGLTVGLVLTILEGFDLGTMEREEALHHMLEAMRLAYADRGRYMADADFVGVPVAGLLNPDFAASRREGITGEVSLAPEAGDPFNYQENPVEPLQPVSWTPNGDTGSISTTHLTTSDAAGNVVSYTYTIETIGGSGIVVPGRGFLLNNELTDFNAEPGGANTVEPRKRPRSSMAPTIVLRDGRPVVALGSPGGATIITTVIQTLINMIDFDMSLPDAINAPRVANLGGDTTLVETNVEAEQALLDALAARGHDFNPTPEIGAVTGIFFNEDGTVTVAAEALRRGSGVARVEHPAE